MQFLSLFRHLRKSPGDDPRVFAEEMQKLDERDPNWDFELRVETVLWSLRNKKLDGTLPFSNERLNYLLRVRDKPTIQKALKEAFRDGPLPREIQSQVHRLLERIA